MGPLSPVRAELKGWGLLEQCFYCTEPNGGMESECETSLRAVRPRRDLALISSSLNWDQDGFCSLKSNVTLALWYLALTKREAFNRLRVLLELDQLPSLTALVGSEAWLVITSVLQ